MGFFEWGMFALVISLVAGSVVFTDPGRGATVTAKVVFGLSLTTALILLVIVILTATTMG